MTDGSLYIERLEEPVEDNMCWESSLQAGTIVSHNSTGIEATENRHLWKTHRGRNALKSRFFRSFNIPSKRADVRA